MIFSQNLLKTIVISFSLLLIKYPPPLFEQLINFSIFIFYKIQLTRTSFAGMPDIVLIWFRATGPTENRRIEISGIDKFLQKGRRLDHSQFDLNPDILKTTLDDFSRFRA